jgi:hypothetical protein
VFSSDRLEIREEEDGGTVVVKVIIFALFPQKTNSLLN